jgi:hypothetical protein
MRTAWFPRDYLLWECNKRFDTVGRFWLSQETVLTQKLVKGVFVVKALEVSQLDRTLNPIPVHLFGCTVQVLKDTWPGDLCTFQDSGLYLC